LFVVRVWGGQYREELIVNVTVFVVRVWGGQYREELIVNVTMFVVRVWGGRQGVLSRMDFMQNSSKFQF